MRSPAVIIRIMETLAQLCYSAIRGRLTIVRSLSAKYRPDRYRRAKSVKFGTELP